MKTIYIALIIFITAAGGSLAQNVNWKAAQGDRPNQVQMNFGYDYAATTSLGYSRGFTLGLPVVAGAQVSLPMGNRMLDDFTIRMGAQVEVVEWRGFTAAVKIGSNFRRFQNELVRMVSFGADFSAAAGYYDPAWYAAAEFGFDKAVATQLTHSRTMKQYGFSGIRDGWYVPTGGNFHYGIQAGVTLSRLADLSLRLGATNAQFDNVDAVLPYYLQLGFGVKF
jgi:hypothetical protein